MTLLEDSILRNAFISERMTRWGTKRSRRTISKQNAGPLFEAAAFEAGKRVSGPIGREGEDVLDRKRRPATRRGRRSFVAACEDSWIGIALALRVYRDSTGGSDEKAVKRDEEEPAEVSEGVPLSQPLKLARSKLTSKTDHFAPYSPLPIPPNSPHSSSTNFHQPPASRWKQQLKTPGRSSDNVARASAMLGGRWDGRSVSRGKCCRRLWPPEGGRAGECPRCRAGQGWGH